MNCRNSKMKTCVVVLAVLVACAIKNSEGCSCVPMTNTQKGCAGDFKSADDVIKAKVKSVLIQPPGVPMFHLHYYKIVPKRKYKLKFGAVLGKKGLRRVYTAEHGATCGVSLQKDKIYLLSGSVNQSEKRLEINSCVSWVEGFPLSRPSRRLARKFKRGKVVCNKFGLINKLTAGDKK